MGKDYTLTQVLSSLPISIQDTTSIKLVNVRNGHIGLGVIDSKFRDQRVTNWWKENVIIHIGFLKQLLGDGKGPIKNSKETKIKNGDILKMKICQVKG